MSPLSLQLPEHRSYLLVEVGWFAGLDFLHEFQHSHERASVVQMSAHPFPVSHPKDLRFHAVLEFVNPRLNVSFEPEPDIHIPEVISIRRLLLRLFRDNEPFGPGFQYGCTVVLAENELSPFWKDHRPNKGKPTLHVGWRLQ